MTLLAKMTHLGPLLGVLMVILIVSVATKALIEWE